MKKPGRKSGRGGLTEEDREMWARVAESIAPLDRDRAIVPAMPEVQIEAPISAPALPKSSAPSRAATGLGRTPPPPPPQPPRPAAPPPLSSLDRRKHRQIASGRVTIDARIDLHGMTQSEAHATLRAFLYGCAARGDRNVLVITGKGSPAARTEHWDTSGRSDRGVLRRNVPRWLDEPDLRGLVIGTSSASARHGGSGALYVQLRARRRRPDDDGDRDR